ncbi:hypothetical protein Tco_0604183 [Tanacetum coccineum]
MSNNFDVRSSDEESTPANDRFSKADRYHAVPPPITGNFLTPRADISFAGLDEFAIRKKIIESKTTELKTDTSKSKTSETVGNTNEVNIEKPKSVYESVVSTPNINREKVIIEDWNSDDEDDVSEVIPETQTVKTQVDKIGQISKKEGIGFKKIKACFVCKSTDHLIRDCDFHEKRMAKQVELNKLKGKGTGQGEKRPVWNNVQRLNHQNNFVPKAVLTKTGRFPVNAARQNLSSQATATSTARKVNTARPIVNEIRPRNNFFKSHSPNRRPFNRPTTSKANPVKVNGVNTAKGNAVKSDVKGNWENVVKPSARCEWRPINVLDNVSKDSASMILKRVNYIDAHELAIPGQTTTSKESSNPFMDGSLPKTIHFCYSLQSDEDKSLSDDASKQGRINIGDIDTDAEITLIDETQGRINDIVADEDITLIPKLIIKQLKILRDWHRHRYVVSSLMDTVYRMSEQSAPTIPVSARENLGDPIDIRMDIIHPKPVAIVAFPAATVRWEEIEGELLTLRERASRAEIEGITLRARVRSLKLIETWLHGIVKDEREAHERIECQLGLI